MFDESKQNNLGPSRCHLNYLLLAIHRSPTDNAGDPCGVTEYIEPVNYANRRGRLLIPCPVEKDHISRADCVRLCVAKIGKLDRITHAAGWCKQTLLMRMVIREQRVVEWRLDWNKKFPDRSVPPEVRKETAVVFGRG
jgi:hypothetical protein